jgi:hypothetical protein
VQVEAFDALLALYELRFALLPANVFNCLAILASELALQPYCALLAMLSLHP